MVVLARRLSPSILLAVGALALAPGAARASEGTFYGGPIGGTGIANAHLPAVPGLYIVLGNVPGYADKLTGPDGHQRDDIRSSKLTYDITVIGLQYVYPFRVFGGRVASGIQEGYWDVYRISLNGRPQTNPGFTDPYVDVFKWSRHVAGRVSTGLGSLPYGLTTQLAFSMVLPFGTYDATRYSTPGHNDLYVIPNAAITYLLPTASRGGTELSLRAYYDHAFRNPKTHYFSGDLVNLDFALSQIVGRAQVGVAGYWAHQYQDDRRDGVVVAPEGKRFEALKIGPVVSFAIPKAHAVLKAKASFPLVIHNAFSGPQYLLAVAFKP